MKNLSVYRPFRDKWGLFDEMNKLFWAPEGEDGEKRENFPANWVPVVDIKEDEEALKIHAELPGIKKEDIKVDVQDDVLTLHGEKKFEQEQKKGKYYRMERSYGAFTRSFTLPPTLDAEKIQAKVENGVLELTIPKKPEAKSRRISVDVG